MMDTQFDLEIQSIVGEDSTDWVKKRRSCPIVHVEGPDSLTLDPPPPYTRSLGRGGGVAPGGGGTNMDAVRQSAGSTPIHMKNGHSSSSSSPKIVKSLFTDKQNSPIRSTSSRSSTGSDNKQGISLPDDQSDAGSSQPGPSSDTQHKLSQPLPQRSKSETKLFAAQSADKYQNVSKLSKRETLKVEKKKYRTEKKRAAKELLSTLKDPSVIVMADWLKVRGTLKSWTKMWCVLKPGLLVLYKTHKQKSSNWVGTVMLNAGELIERPSKKDGFCFKLFHPLDQSIWATKGPKGENFGALTQPLPYSYLIFRAPSEPAGKCWMDALELALRCSTLLMKTMTKENKMPADDPGDNSSANLEDDGSGTVNYPSTLRTQMNDSDCEKHFEGYGLEEDAKTDREEEEKKESDTDSDLSEEEKEVFDDDLQPIETHYTENMVEELGQQGDACQTEEVADENKSIIWSLVKQVRPGMDLSKVVLPTFILEPRSFLDKLTDYYYHADLLAEAVVQNDAFSRMKNVVKWYLSGFYKKPKGLKKPYNPILGETFRCYWKHPKTASRTFYMAEQISHHPPVSAWYITNRQDGFSISGSILAKSKFYGNSLSAILDGVARLSLLTRGEDYLITMPYAHCKGILIGTLTMELGGKVSIECEKTGYKTDLEFKLKPFLGSGEASNRVTGKIRLGGETLVTLDGKWDQDIYIKDKRTGESEIFWNPTADVKSNRLKRFTVPIDAQKEFESERLWRHVTEALATSDQDKATNEKFILEDAQRREAKERKVKMEDWVPRYFERNPLTADWEYKYKDLRPWDPLNDLIQYEHEYIISTKTRHRTPIVRTTSITNMEDDKRKSQSPIERARLSRMKRMSMKRMGVISSQGSESSTPDADRQTRRDSETSESDGNHQLAAIKESKSSAGSSSLTGSNSKNNMSAIIDPLLSSQRKIQDTLDIINNRLAGLQRHLVAHTDTTTSFRGLVSNRDLFVIAIVVAVQMVLFVIFR